MSEDLGFGGEPQQTPYENGKVLAQHDLVGVGDDERFALVEELVDSEPTDYDDARRRLGFDAVDAARNLISADQNIESKEAAKEAGIPERLVTVEERCGYIPRNGDELNDAYDLIGKDLIAGAATHLNTVLHRQKRYMDDPDRTVRSIVARYAEYAKNARVEHAFLTQVDELVSGERGGVHPSRLGSEWQYSGSLSRPVLHMLWMQDVTSFMQSGEGANPLKGVKDGQYLTSNKEAIARAQAMLNGSKRGFSDTLAHSILSEKSRADFWINALQEARRHKLAAGVAYGALVDLGVEKAEGR